MDAEVRLSELERKVKELERQSFISQYDTGSINIRITEQTYRKMIDILNPTSGEKWDNMLMWLLERYTKVHELEQKISDLEWDITRLEMGDEF